MALLAAVAVGGALGACLRYGILLAVGRFQAGFPYATLVANVLGCAAIGLLLFLIDQRAYLNPQWRAFLVTGMLGSLTTFSTFGVETYTLWIAGERTLALVAVLAHLVLGLGAVALGWRTAASVF